MAKRIVIIQGHPDPAGGHLCHALADAYAAGARGQGTAWRR
jgi:putative NADPH-quinone reductase